MSEEFGQHGSEHLTKADSSSETGKSLRPENQNHRRTDDSDHATEQSASVTESKLSFKRKRCQSTVTVTLEERLADLERAPNHIDELIDKAQSVSPLKLNSLERERRYSFCNLLLSMGYRLISGSSLQQLMTELDSQQIGSWGDKAHNNC